MTCVRRAEQLIGGLGDERERWQESADRLSADLKNLVGNVMLASGCLAYLGPFTSQFRKVWSAYRLDPLCLFCQQCTTYGLRWFKLMWLTAVNSYKVNIHRCASEYELKREKNVLPSSTSFPAFPSLVPSKCLLPVVCYHRADDVQLDWTKRQDMASGWVKLCKERAIPVADDFSLEGEIFGRVPQEGSAEG